MQGQGTTTSGAAGGDEQRGFNPQIINGLRDVINTTAQNCGAKVIEHLTDGVVKPISTAWYAQEAINYFEGFKETVKACGEAIHETFDTFRINVENAGKAWEEKTSSAGEVSLAILDPIELNLDISSILAINEAGNIYLDPSAVNTVISSLAEVEASIKSDLGTEAANLDAATAFLGGGQAESVEECFVKVAESVEKIFKFLTEGENSLSAALTKAIETYKEQAAGVQRSFSQNDSQVTSIAGGGGTSHSGSWDNGSSCGSGGADDFDSTSSSCGGGGSASFGSTFSSCGGGGADDFDSTSSSCGGGGSADF